MVLEGSERPQLGCQADGLLRRSSLPKQVIVLHHIPSALYSCPQVVSFSP